MTPVINYVAVIVATIVSMVLGFVWFGPLFGKPWMAMMGFTKDSMEKAKAKGMTQSYAVMIVGSLLMAYILSHSLAYAAAYTQTSGVNAGLMTGFWNWLGFIAPVVVGDQLWGGKPWKLFLITGGYWLVTLCAMGVVLAVMK